jgi:hypothetical protein
MVITACSNTTIAYTFNYLKPNYDLEQLHVHSAAAAKLTTDLLQASRIRCRKPMARHTHMYM